MADETTTEATPDNVIRVPVVKGKGFVDIDTASIPDDVYREILLQGLKVLVNRGTSKVTKTTYPNAEELKAKAMEVALAQVELIKTSKIKFTGQKKSAVSGAVRTEAMRLARALVKAEMKKAGIKVSHVKASEITEAAKQVLEAMPELVKEAEANIKAREGSSTPAKINIKALVKTDPELVKKAEAKKAKDQLSAKQAGQTATRKKGQGAQANA